MARHLSVAVEAWPIRGAFRIARGAKTEAKVVVVTITDGGFTGRGECVPYGRYGESVDSVVAEITALRQEMEQGLTRESLQSRMHAGAARNALDCALIDWEAKASGKRAFELLSLPTPQPVSTAFTLSVDSPEAMAAAAAEAAAKGYRLLKLKIAGGQDVARVEAVRGTAPKARLIVDANEGLSLAELKDIAPHLARLNVVLIEQPLKAAEDEALAGYKCPVPLCADESCHTRADLARLSSRYSHINVKLDKAGGLTEAVALTRAAAAQGFGLMVGCMVSTSLAMAPASLLAGMAEFTDLDGPLLLARDREPAMRYEADRLYPAPADLWG